MKVPLSWLRELVDIDVEPDDLAVTLSMRGAAVDSVERFAPGVSGVVVSRVVDVADVPESDRLCIAHLDNGKETMTVLAGAKNFRAGDLVAYAMPGARVTTLDEPLGVRPMVGGKYRSHGMLCSARELGVSDEHGGILVLDTGAPVGADVVQLLGLDDVVFEFEIYPNRPDQMSILGIAREVAVIYDKSLRYPDMSVVEDDRGVGAMTSVEIVDREKCPRYLARVVEDVTFGPSPALVQARLTACGVRPLGNLVDATNYVLLLTGQPLHAFDLDRLGEQRIVVRRASSGEHLTTLDGEDRALESDDLVIADATEAQALAGIMGGQKSEVDESTKRVLLESAYFEAMGIARTARRHHLRSEASARFERGADPEMVPDAAALAAEFMRRWAGGRVARGAVDAGAAPPRKAIVLRPERIEAILGIAVGADEAARVLSSLGCDVSSEDPITATPPSWRPDLEREIDLVEEVARLHGYETIPAVERAGYRGGRSVAQELRERVRDVLLGCGLHEATLSTFVHQGDIEAVGYRGETVGVVNPMTEDQRQLRPSLFPGLLRAAQRNVARGVRNVRLFEIGSIFRGWGDELPDESEHMAFVLVGDRSDEHWSTDPTPVDAFDGKGIVENVLGGLGLTVSELVTDDVLPLFHPGRSANVMLDGVRVGCFGEVRPSVAKAFDLDGVVVGGLTLAPLFDAAPAELAVRELPTQPPALRDIAISVPEATAAGDVLATIRRAGGELLEAVDLVDVYRGEQVGQGRKSLAFRLVFRVPDRTLVAAEADAAREAIASAVGEEHGGEVR